MAVGVGGANEEAMRLIERFGSVADAEAGVRDMLAKKVKIMGFGHRVYKTRDPRSDIIKSCSERMAALPEGKPLLVDISKRIEKVERIATGERDVGADPCWYS